MKEEQQMPAKPKLNVRLLRKIQRHILEEPRRFAMSISALHGEPGTALDNYCFSDGDEPGTFPACGTVGCLAGWANILTGARKGNEDSIARAAKQIGVKSTPSWEDHPLFFAPNWPAPFARKYRKAKTPKTRAKIASARIEYLIKEGK